MKKKTKRWPVRPHTAIRAKDGKLYVQCEACDGTGHPTEWVSRSDRSGTYGRQLSRTKCERCDGRGYSPGDEVRIVEGRQ